MFSKTHVKSRTSIQPTLTTVLNTLMPFIMSHGSFPYSSLASRHNESMEDQSRSQSLRYPYPAKRAKRIAASGNEIDGGWVDIFLQITDFVNPSLQLVPSITDMRETVY